MHRPRRLSGLDASFLYMEAPHLPMHTLKVAILDVSEVAGGYRFSRVAEVLATHIHRLPALRRRIVPVPFGLHHPLWLEDPEFRVEAHVERVILPDGADAAALDETIARLSETPLDRGRPLWQLWAVEGLRDEMGRPLVAFVCKIHHAVADGLAAAEMLRRIMSEPPGTADPLPANPLPGPGAVAVQALGQHLRQMLGLPRLIGISVRGGLRALRQRRSAEVQPPRLFTGERAVFSRAISERRSFARVCISLPAVRRIKEALGCTINDVVLAVVAGALRRYLLARGETVDEPLIASVPASTGGAHVAGNRVSSLYTALRVDLADPVERLRAIQAVTLAAKERHAALGEDMLANWLEFTRRAPHAWLWQRLLPRLRRPPLHLVVSNVPGPGDSMVIDGARMVGLASVGPLLEGVGVNVTVWSYVDMLCFAVLACPDNLPDLPRVMAGLGEALAELEAATAEPRPLVAS